MEEFLNTLKDEQNTLTISIREELIKLNQIITDLEEI